MTYIIEYKFRDDEIAKYPSLSREWQYGYIRFNLGEAMRWCQNHLYGRRWRMTEYAKIGDVEKIVGRYSSHAYD